MIYDPLLELAEVIEILDMTKKDIKKHNKEHNTKTHKEKIPQINKAIKALQTCFKEGDYYRINY